MRKPRGRAPLLRTAEGNAPSERVHYLARSSFDIETVRVGRAAVRVTQSDCLSLPFGILTTFSHPKVGTRRILVVAPLAGGFAVLLRDLVIGLLPHGTVSVTDWLNARYVVAHDGQFGLEDNIRYVIAMMRQLGPGSGGIAQPSACARERAFLSGPRRESAARQCFPVFCRSLRKRHQFLADIMVREDRFKTRGAQVDHLQGSAG